MTNTEKIKAMSIAELGDFLEKTTTEDSEWIVWFNEHFCQECEPIIKEGHECSYCEIHDICKHFTTLATDRAIIDLWLSSNSL